MDQDEALRIVQDILRRFLVALKRIKDVKGVAAVVPEMDNRKRRRLISQMPYHHPDCADAMQRRIQNSAARGVDQVVPNLGT